MRIFARNVEPAIPVDIADAVEMWARQRGRHARLTWNAIMGCPVVTFTLPENATGNRDVQEGRAAEATESVPLHEWDGERGRYVPLVLGDYGASGIINLLESWDMHSGRGLYDSIQARVAAMRAENERVRESHRRAADEGAADLLDLKRRSALDIPYHTVGIDLKHGG